MHVSVNFKNIDSSDLLVSAVEKKLLKLDKLFDKPAEARVAFSAEKDKYKTDISLTSGKLSLRASETSDNMYSSIDQVAEKLKTQLNRTKDKFQNRKNRKGLGEIVADTAHEDEELTEPE